MKVWLWRKESPPRLAFGISRHDPLIPCGNPNPLSNESFFCWKLPGGEQAQNVLDVTDSDVFMLGAHFPQKLGRDPSHMVLIGRARVSKIMAQAATVVDMSFDNYPQPPSCRAHPLGLPWPY